MHTFCGVASIASMHFASADFFLLKVFFSYLSSVFDLWQLSVSERVRFIFIKGIIWMIPRYLKREWIQIVFETGYGKYQQRKSAKQLFP